jgi:hypothetical protein
MRLDRGGVDEKLRRRAASLRERVEEIDPHALGRPPDITVVERLPRPVFRRRVDPAPAGFQHVDNPADHAPIVDPRLAPRVSGEVRRNLRKLGVGQPKAIRNHRRFLSEACESRHRAQANNFIGPSPKFLVDDEVLCRIKKANGSGLGSNIQTQEVMDFICQEPGIPGLLEEVHKIEICYFEDPTGAEIASVHVTARDNDVKLWSYEIERDEPGMSGAIVPFPITPPDAPPPEIEPKPAKQENRGEKE